MPRYKANINAIYISERIQESLRQIKECAMTTIIAPMGYGKTTAALWYLEEQRRQGDMVFRVNIYSSDVDLFWQSFCGAFYGTLLGDRLTGMSFPSSKTAVGMFVQNVTEFMNTMGCHMFLLIDDCHLMKDNRVLSLLLALCDIPTDRLHIIVASRSVLLLSGE